MTKIAKELKMLRIKHEVSQECLAQQLGVTKASYSRKENGKIAFSLEDVKKLKKIFKLTIEEVEKIFFN